MRLLTHIFTSAAMALMTATAGIGAPDGAMEAKNAEKAPAFRAVDHEGNEHSLSDYEGKVVVLEWLNPDCPFVQRHYREGTMKELATLYEENGVIWLAVNSTSSHDRERSSQWAESNSLPYPVLVDSDGSLGHEYGARTTPHIFVIDRGGNLVYDGAIDNDPGGGKDQRINYAARAIESALKGEMPDTRRTKPYGCSVKYASN